MIRPGLNLETKDLYSAAAPGDTGDSAATVTGTVVGTVDYTGIAIISANTWATTSTDTSMSPTCAITIETAVDSAFASPNTRLTFATAASDTAGGDVETQELDMQLSKGYFRPKLTIVGTAASCPVSIVGLFPKRGW
jgi:hypothetical protein